ncbi:MAG: hypothetical protein U5L45_09550 [Saprospiraceae bacterium]|nr:hypothetical protein [Saprospiraceae bacterium]
MVHFSGFARKMNHLSLMRERSERVVKYSPLFLSLLIRVNT